MAHTEGLSHLGLAVKDLDETTSFFVEVLGWSLTARDGTYPRTTVTDGKLRLTLWQTEEGALPFDRRTQIGLHHLAMSVPTEDKLMELAQTLSTTEGVDIAFMPEFMGDGPRKHMMFHEPGGLRLELVWAGDN